MRARRSAVPPMLGPACCQACCERRAQPEESAPHPTHGDLVQCVSFPPPRIMLGSASCQTSAAGWRQAGRLHSLRWWVGALPFQWLCRSPNPARRFLRIPGGCVIEGDVLALRFQWKKALGSIAQRPGHWDIWGYWNSDGGPGLVGRV